MQNTPILIIGMARSGTTFVANLLGGFDNVKVLIEPHILWRTGNFKHYFDDSFEVKEKIIQRIRTRMNNYADGMILVEKSPINCLRARLVHATFPEAKIIFLEREKEDCIKSNYIRSLKRDSFNPSIIFKKYLGRYQDEDLQYSSDTMSVTKQLFYSDLFYFTYFVIKSFFYRNILKVFPFGPKLKDFSSLIKNYGLIDYHNTVFEKSLKNKQYYQEKYKNNLSVFKFERLCSEEKELSRLFDFCGFKYNKGMINNILQDIDIERINIGKKRNNKKFK